MSTKPPAVTGLDSTASITTTEITWRSLGLSPLMDHYRVHGRPGRHTALTLDNSTLVGKTVYPRFRHTSLDPAGEEWTYQIVAVSDAGLRGSASRPLVAHSQASVTATGTPVAVIGDFDAKTLELQFAPAGYTALAKANPTAAIDYVQGTDTPAKAWPYLLPGPSDAWAGSRVWRARWHLEGITKAPHALALWLVDTTKLGGKLQININGRPFREITQPVGSTRGSREGDATVVGSPLVRSFHEFELPARTLTSGKNVIEFVVTEGGWVAWDAVGVFSTS